MTAVAVRPTGRHHAPGLLRRYWRRLLGQRAGRAQLKANAGRAARRAAIISPVIAASGHLPYLPAIIAAAAVLAVAAPLGVKW